MEKNVLIEQLSKDIVTLSFTKKDGTERVMKCTRNLNLIPTEFQPKSETKNESETGDNIRVFDIEKQGWRSFNFSSVKV